jgi:ABC-type molybdenum transport system ATPase subunit/photorepair protein PhrA
VAQRNANAITGLETAKRTQIEQSLSRDIRVEKFTLSYQSKVLFKDADLRVSFGHKYGLIGPNGAGKRCVARIRISLWYDSESRLSVLIETRFVGGRGRGRACV